MRRQHSLSSAMGRRVRVTKFIAKSQHRAIHFPVAAGSVMQLDDRTSEGKSGGPVDISVRAKLFISYKRSVATDEKLAHALRDSFRQQGHEVFIDVAMTVGTDWVTEIARRIRWCDFLVVLLSEAAIDSEMVQAEVRMAHQRRRSDGTPGILPVRVDFEGPLDYELDAYLGRIQYVLWRGDDDTRRVIADLQHSIAATGAAAF